jgi:hypothetical protein
VLSCVVLRSFTLIVQIDVCLLIHRSMVRELPRVLTLYDVDMPLKEAKKAVAYHFYKNKHVQDPR